MTVKLLVPASPDWDMSAPAANAGGEILDPGSELPL
jgi:hypothetical protein